jgi:hypothetical protein
VLYYSVPDDTAALEHASRLVRELRQGGEHDDPGLMMIVRDELLKTVLSLPRAAGRRGRNVRELNIRVSLDRLVKGGYLVGRPISRDLVQYRITQRGQDAIVEHDL